MNQVERYNDDATGVEVQVLTPGPGKDDLVYQTHPRWTPGMTHLVYRSAPPEERAVPYAREMASGRIDAFTEALVLPGHVEDWVLSCRDDRMFCRCGDSIAAVRVADAFSTPKAERGGIEVPVRRYTDLAKYRPISLTLDAGEKTMYLGLTIEPDKEWGIAALDIGSDEWRITARMDFRVGHIQANPVTPGLVMFCHETGGESPQRMWLLDAESGEFRPFYKETYDEWVTHEVWWGADRAIFTVWPYDEKHTKLPHGVVSADLATATPTVHSQFPAWHTHGSPDGKWAVADDMARRIWLICVADGQRRLLTTGHNSPGFKTHPHPSFTPDGKAVVFNSSRLGAEDICMVVLPDWESLPLA